MAGPSKAVQELQSLITSRVRPDGSQGVAFHRRLSGALDSPDNQFQYRFDSHKAAGRLRPIGENMWRSDGRHGDAFYVENGKVLSYRQASGCGYTAPSAGGRGLASALFDAWLADEGVKTVDDLVPLADRFHSHWGLTPEGAAFYSAALERLELKQYAPPSTPKPKPAPRPEPPPGVVKSR